MVEGNKSPRGGLIRAYCSLALLLLVFLIFLWSIFTGSDFKGKCSIFMFFSSVPLGLLFILSLVNLVTEEGGWTSKLAKNILLVLLAGTVVVNTIGMALPDLLLALTGVGMFAIPVLHGLGLLIAILVGYHTFHFDKAKYSDNRKYALVLSWIVIWVVSMLSYFITFIVVELSGGSAPTYGVPLYRPKKG